MKKKVLITAALPYINNVPHMGHIVGSHLPADIFYRYCIQKGLDATFIGGSDEHGTPSVIAAMKAKKGTKEFVDSLHAIHEKIYKKLNISYSNYSRTTNESHHMEVKEFFNKAYENGYITSSKSEMYYSEKDKMFLPDRFITGTCPRCKNEGANGDQCEKCSYIFKGVTELLNPKSTLSNATPVLRESTHLYINLESLSEALEEWIDGKKDVWKNHVYSEAKKWLREGLKSRSITRDMDWGIGVPLEEFENKVFYVWFDAPIGYITFAKEIDKGEWWKDGEVYHFLGKDNIPFHTIFWPSMLIANETYKLPHEVVGYNYLNFEGQKFSKSKGVGVFCYHLLSSDLDIDSLRFYLTSVLPENKDSDFKWEDFRNLVNGELIGNFSNFCNRTLNMVWKNLDGSFTFDGVYKEKEKGFMAKIEEHINHIKGYYDSVEIRAARRTILELSSLGNKYFDEMEPWKLAKEGKVEELKGVLNISLNIIRSLAILMAPILPDKMEKLWKEQLDLEGSPLEEEAYMSLGTVFNSHKINKPSPLFKRIEKEDLDSLRDYFAQPYNL